MNGLEWRRGWFSGQRIPSTGVKKAGVLTLTIGEKNKKFYGLYIPGPAAPTQPLVINMALLGFNVITDVKRGENSGSRLEHDFVVLGFCSMPLIATADKGFRSDPVELKSSTEDVPGAVVAWVSGNDAAILQVTGGWLSAPDQK